MFTYKSKVKLYIVITICFLIPLTLTGCSKNPNGTITNNGISQLNTSAKYIQNQGNLLNNYPSLRGGITTDQQTINIALDMQNQGWEYIMPQPKSPEAAWGNTDGRTTWWNGYWYNIKTGQYSSITPYKKFNEKTNNVQYIGNGINPQGWRRGGSPRRPNKFEWLLSKHGGIKP
jgi:hypothetical protein